MPRFEVELKNTVTHTYKFKINAQDEVAAHDHAEKLVKELNDAEREPARSWEKELEDFEWELEDVSEE